MCIITLIGSSKLKDIFLSVKRILSLNGNIVFDLPVYSKADGISLTKEEIDTLTDVCKKKIKMSDGVAIIIDETWTIGEHTYTDYLYAKECGLEIVVISGTEKLKVSRIKDVVPYKPGSENRRYAIIPGGKL